MLVLALYAGLRSTEALADWPLMLSHAGAGALHTWWVQMHLEGHECGRAGFQSPGDRGSCSPSDTSLMCNLDRSRPSPGFLKPQFLPL